MLEFVSRQRRKRKSELVGHRVEFLVPLLKLKASGYAKGRKHRRLVFFFPSFNTRACNQAAARARAGARVCAQY